MTSVNHKPGQACWHWSVLVTTVVCWQWPRVDNVQHIRWLTGPSGQIRLTLWWEGEMYSLTPTTGLSHAYCPLLDRRQSVTHTTHLDQPDEWPQDCVYPHKMDCMVCDCLSFSLIKGWFTLPVYFRVKCHLERDDTQAPLWDYITATYYIFSLETPTKHLPSF